jgi:cytidylate kinase
MAIVTISRQYGSRGNEIALRVCDMLGYYLFDKKLMTSVAREMGLAPNEFVDFTEDNYQMQSFLERLFGQGHLRIVTQRGIWWEATGEDLTEEMVDIDESYGLKLVQSIIQAAYQKDKVVIVGRGGQAILKDKPGVVHVRIVAPYHARVQYLHERKNFSYGGAKDAAIKHDRASAEYLKRFYSIDWNDPTLYDLVINTNKLDVETAAQLIVQTVNHLPVLEPASEEEMQM